MTSASLKPEAGPARRTVMAAAGAAGLAAALTACGSGDDSSDTVNTGSGSSGTTGSTGSTGSTGASQDSGSSASGGSGGGTALAKTADIPEGGGKIFKDEGVVVTQPTAGTYKAFSSKCTHQGCAVGSVANGVIVCPCHNSHFSVEDGSVKQGPATQALAAAKITVSGDEIKLS
ncbi:Rieske (2Fe-2S) protein [Streptomyces sp. Ag109_G2-15]|uniref:Rieske (2Fe-2S) protein n=1 Tax=Streptomyces sp. Ag109_G2-15 TaxID=1938850 RepID=UPI000BDC8C70|nr:Rieske (2Fe-2S) protein [Streptomyces sp. Ag109_G2-15]SOD88334.1 Ferredoxin subunit of nitrite reductase or a ring-hydroxylating dioxygenase [Streptomyces sp. Ag109_G2-15]